MMQILKSDIKENIIEAAINEFYEKGYEKASMRNIAKSANISISNTYNYFESKDQLFNEILEPIYDYILQLFNQSYIKYSGGKIGSKEFLEFIDNLTRVLVESSTKNRRLIIILTEKSAGSKFEKAKDEIIELLELHFIKELVNNNQVTDNEPSKCYMFNVIASNFISGFLKIINDYKNNEWVDENIKLFMKYHLNGIFSLKE